MMRRGWALATLALAGTVQAGAPVTLAEQREALLTELQSVHALDAGQVASVRAIFSRAPYMGQGNPAITVHPFTREECRTRLEARAVDYANPDFERVCGARYMAPLYDPATETMEEAQVCIDQFEFPNIPCEYPVVWVRAREAAELCEALGKRMCDAHEWEGACAGSLQPPDYRFDLARDATPSAAVSRMRNAHNAAESERRTWAYGSSSRHGVCAMGSRKSEGCGGGEWSKCGSNTYPTGSFPDCHSPLQVYDQHGNAAEHMNLPFSESQMASRGSRDLGYTEMKGSWFIFDSYRAHDDDCRWRAPYWHGSRVMDAKSHHNYHLGFRCCKTLDGARAPGSSEGDTAR